MEIRHFVGSISTGFSVWAFWVTLASFTANATPDPILDLGPTTVFDVAGSNALNNNPQAAGALFRDYNLNWDTQPAVYSNGSVTGLGTLGGEPSHGDDTGMLNIRKVLLRCWRYYSTLIPV